MTQLCIAPYMLLYKVIQYKHVLTSAIRKKYDKSKLDGIFLFICTYYCYHCIRFNSRKELKVVKKYFSVYLHQ